MIDYMGVIEHEKSRNFTEKAITYHFSVYSLHSYDGYNIAALSFPNSKYPAC